MLVFDERLNVFLTIMPNVRSQIIVNAVANWLGFAAQLIVAFFLAPILVHALGDERNGIWSLVESILAYLMLFDLGVAVSVVRYVARFEATGDWDKLNRIFSTSLVIFAAAGALAMLVALGLAFPFVQLLSIAGELRNEARWMLLLLGVNLAIGLPLSVFPCVLDGLSRYPVKTMLRTTVLIIRSILFVVILNRGGGLIGLAWAISGCNLAEHLLMGLAAWWYLPSLRFSIRLVDRATFKTIRGYSLDAFLALIAGRVSFQTDALVIGLFQPARFITFFAIAARLVEYAKNAVRAFTSVLVPTVSSLEALGELEKIRKVIVVGTRYVLWIIIPVEAGLLFLGKPFLALWMGHRYVSLCYPTLAILTVPLGLAMAQSVAARVLYGMGQLRWFARAVIAEAVVNLLLSLALVGPLGIEGVALGTSIPNVINNLLILGYVCRVVGLEYSFYLRRAWLVPTLWGVVLAFGWWTTEALIPTRTWTSLLATGFSGLSAFWAIAGISELGLEPLLKLSRSVIGGNSRATPLLVAEEYVGE
ncbi:MAG TPA: polysaccharide biosynthesis C-terminal domain-containing protein [Gemmataceae bacterium]|nr:polysaccharide biosynthesis C-terminal domain-containing protein [Gemmataceae bacterium]